MKRLQQTLLRAGQHIPGVVAEGLGDLARTATITASSTLTLADLPTSGETASEHPHALLLPVTAGDLPAITLLTRVEKRTTLRAELWASGRRGNTTPDVFLEALEVALDEGDAVSAVLHFASHAHQSCHLLVVVPPFEGGALLVSKVQRPGLLTLSQKMNAAVAKSAVQTPPEGSGIDSFAFWLPDRRPAARNLAVTIEPALKVYEAEMVVNGLARPWGGANAWAPADEDAAPWLQLSWNTTQTIHAIQITFDTDYDHPMESVLMTHPEHVMPGCVTAFRIVTDEGALLADVAENHKTRWSITFNTAVRTSALRIEILGRGPAPPAIFEVRCY